MLSVVGSSSNRGCFRRWLYCFSALFHRWPLRSTIIRRCFSPRRSGVAEPEESKVGVCPFVCLGSLMPVNQKRIGYRSQLKTGVLVCCGAGGSAAPENSDCNGLTERRPQQRNCIFVTTALGSVCVHHRYVIKSTPRCTTSMAH